MDWVVVGAGEVDAEAFAIVGKGVDKLVGANGNPQYERQRTPDTTPVDRVLLKHAKYTFKKQNDGGVDL